MHSSFDCRQQSLALDPGPVLSSLPVAQEWDGSRISGLNLFLEKTCPNQNLLVLPTGAQVPRIMLEFLQEVKATLPRAVALTGRITDWRGEEGSFQLGLPPTPSLHWAVLGAHGHGTELT